MPSLRQVPGGLLAVALAACSSGCAQRATNLILDNDQYSDGAGDDRDYTQGLFFEQQIEADTSGARLGTALLHPFRFLERLAVAERDATTEDLSFRLEQRLYTPANVFASVPILDERPYSAQIGLFFVRQRQFLDPDPGRARDRHSRMALGFGQTGDLAFGEPSQRGIHAIIGEPDPVGWDNELEGEPFVQLEFDRTDRWWRGVLGQVELEARTRAGLDLGTVRSRAHAEAEVRIGQGLPRGLRPWAEDGSGAQDSGADSGLFLFGAFGGLATAHDHSIEGSLFRDDWPLEAEPFIAAWRMGLVWIRNGFTVSYTFDRRQKEYDTEIGSHDFGRIQIGYALQF